uniref:Putative secreted protein n=1 Tax=Anopheles marajoara TaxID=58244 RepID=A0A2M4CF99_9DIPT
MCCNIFCAMTIALFRTPHGVEGEALAVRPIISDLTTLTEPTAARLPRTTVSGCETRLNQGERRDKHTPFA